MILISIFLEKLSWQIQGQTFPSEGEQLENIKIQF